METIRPRHLLPSPLAEKRLVGNGDTSPTCKRQEADKTTLPPELQVDPWSLAHNHGKKRKRWNHGKNPAYGVQRMLVLMAKNKAHALELSERFRELFIEGGWKELTRQPSPAISSDVAEEENRPFWQ